MVAGQLARRTLSSVQYGQLVIAVCILEPILCGWNLFLVGIFSGTKPSITKRGEVYKSGKN